MLGHEDFKPVTLADRAFFESHYARYPQSHSSNSFTNMVCWNHLCQYRYAYINGNVIISSTVSGTTQFRPPIGPRDPELMRSLLKLAIDTGGYTPLTLIDSDTAQWIKEIDPDLVMVPDLSYFEYVYRASDLMELPGRNYRKIRSQINRFRKKYRYTVESITPGNRKEVEEFFVKWCEHKGCKNNPALEKEIEAVFYAIDHFTELFLRGILIRIDSQVSAISLFERLNADTALIHFEKGIPEYEGIYKAVNMYAAAVLADEVEYINRESDLGVSGLREAKLRYHPHHMVEVYSLRLQACSL